MELKITERTTGLWFREDGAHVCLWSPEAKAPVLVSGDLEFPLSESAGGYWSARISWLQPGMHYRFRSGDRQFPDPAALEQPEGVHGPSRAIDTRSFHWTDQDWENPALSDYIIYELHTGTFTQEANFSGIIARLDYLRELGITAIELMPVSTFPGKRNWGYDGVFPFSVHSSYGGPEGLQQLVDACHSKGIAVILDVVYNHLGPEGNYLSDTAPYFTDAYKTPWGQAINLDDAGSDGVRRYFIDNALMWFRDFHIDALRLDAIHAIKDFSALHLLQELRRATDELSAKLKRECYLIAESDLNDPRVLDPLSENGFAMNAQWTDDFHHALMMTAGAQPDTYLSDFRGIRDLAKAYRDGFVYEGQYSVFRRKRFGRTARHHEPDRFVVFAQNHDQTGNRPFGERSVHLFSPDMLRLMAAAVVLSPYIPMLFMGEEWACTAPFLYFVSPEDHELAESIRKGRLNELLGQANPEQLPDPTAEDSFLRSRLDWSELGLEPHDRMLRYYQRLIRIRKLHPALQGSGRDRLTVHFDELQNTLSLHYRHGGHQLVCLMNFSAQHQDMILPETLGTAYLLLDSAAQQQTNESGQPGTTDNSRVLRLQPESLLLYADSYV